MNVKTFVVPLDCSELSERALPIAEAMAARVGGGLLLVSAQFHGPLDPHEYLDEQTTRITHCPVDISPTKHEHAAAAITGALEGSDDRILCMTTHGRGSFRWAAVGSVAEEVMLKTDRPVLLIGPHCHADALERGTHLLVCADHAEAAAGLAPAVHEWAERLDLRPRVAVAVHPIDVESAEHSDVVLGPLAQALGMPNTDEAELLRATYVTGALADYAADLPAALIAINSHARSGIRRFALGSETMAVVHLAPCPVLVVHTL